MIEQCGGGGGGGGGSSFSVLSWVPNHDGAGHHEMMMGTCTNNIYGSSSNSPSAVDCTLSLGTPSTRSSEWDSDKRAAAVFHHRRSPGSYVSNLCWDLLHPRHKTSTSSGSGAAPATNSGAVADPLLIPRRCANCNTTSTPLWRNGPTGPKSLCNACGIRFKKEERRAAAETNNHHMLGGSYSNSTTAWVPQHPPATTQKHPWLSAAAAAINNELPMFIGNDDVGRNEPDNGISFLSWRLNVTDHRPSLVHDFTR